MTPDILLAPKARSSRTAVLTAPGHIEIQQREVPPPGPHQVTVAIASVGVCGSDVHYYEHGRIGDFVVTGPLVLGHESAGTVVAVGSDVTTRQVGDRVAVEPGVPCGRCRQCRAGRYNLCPDVVFLATPPIDGALTEYLNIDADFAHPIPDALDFDSAAMAEPMSVAVAANRQAGTTVGTRVLVTGAGPIGMLVAAVAKASGAGFVAVSDINPARLQQSARFGADLAVTPRNGSDIADLDVDVAIECSGNSTATASAVEALAPGGTLVMVGMSAESVNPIPTARIQNRELTVKGAFRYANTYPAAIAAIAAGTVPMDELIGLRFPLDESEKALTAGHTHPDVLKTVVTITER
jgi:L-iditol 2-dehydrogenase